ncbi:unnamed protein product [Caenorhabditis auriculariae]|uniref:RING-type domain-containing protein n=1 Tax=Caenorhabditis auriculariae TaxID=2777116 RepID=A0A8S1GZB5_9PELO|nr:unnamed protein product [Caenorhabditis auriculariae]
MWASSQILSDIIRPCTACHLPFDGNLHSPQLLPCSHTFCRDCLLKEENAKKKKCFECRASYSKYTINVILLEAVRRLEERKKWFDTQLRRCDECDSRVPVGLMRRCSTCELALINRTKFEYRLDCIICLECCVNSHNGHEVQVIAPRFVVKRTSSNSISSSTDSSDCQNDQKRGLGRNLSLAQRMKSRICGVFRMMSMKGRSSGGGSFKILSSRHPDTSQLFNESEIVQQRHCSFYESDESPSWKSNRAKGRPTTSLSTEICGGKLDSNRSPSFLTDEMSFKDTFSVDSVFEPRSAEADYNPAYLTNNGFNTEGGKTDLQNGTNDYWRLRMGVSCGFQPRMKPAFPFYEQIPSLFLSADGPKIDKLPVRARETKSDSSFLPHSYYEEINA